MALPQLDLEPQAPSSTLLGRVFRTAFGTIARHPVKLAVVALTLGVAPSLLIDWLLEVMRLPTSAAGLAPGHALGIGARLSDVASASATAAAVRAVPFAVLWSVAAQTLWYDCDGKQPDLGVVLSWSVASVPRVAITGVIFGLAVSLGGVLIVPGLLALLIWSVALPVSTLEGTGPRNSLDRSAELTRGHRGKIFGLIVAYKAPLLAFAWLGGLIVARQTAESGRMPGRGPHSPPSTTASRRPSPP